ncbi:MAG: EpsG family protein [Bacillota bacterium]|jgi:hypothetical protein
MTYIITFGIVLSLSYIYDHSSTRQQKLCIGIAIIMILTLIGGLRSIEIGTDNYNYKYIYDVCRNNDLLTCLQTGYTSQKETGFILFVWFISKINESYLTFTLITSFLTIFFVFEGMKYFADNYDLSIRVMLGVYLFIYYCCFFNLVRQGMALAIVFFAFKYADQKKIVKFIIFVLIASTIQISLLAAIPIYLLFNLNNSRRIINTKKTNRLLFLLLGIAIALFIFIGPLFASNIFNIVSKIPFLPIEKAKLMEMSSTYASVSSYSFGTGIFIRAVPHVIIIALFYDKIRDQYRNINGLYIAEWIQIAIMLMGSVYEPVTRIAYIYNYSQMILFSAIEKRYRRTNNKLFIELLMFGYCIVYWILFTVLNHYGYDRPVYPYQFASW